MFCADPEAEVRAALRTAEQAIAADESSPVAFWAYGAARWRSGDHEAALTYTARAIQLGPSLADAHIQSGFINAHHGDPEVGLRDLERAEALSPFDAALDTILLSRAMANLRLGNLPEAARNACLSASQPRVYSEMQCIAAMVAAASGDRPGARKIVDHLHRSAQPYNREKLFRAPYDLGGDVRTALQGAATALGL